MGNLIKTTAQINELLINSIRQNDKKYKFICCAIRNTGAGFVLINDSEHEPVGVASIAQDANTITLNYDFVASQVGSLVVVPDEIMAKNGIIAGASVGLALSVITVYKSYFVNAYITKSGGASPAYTINQALSFGVSAVIPYGGGDQMQITHDNYDLPNYTTGRVVAKSGNQNCYISSYGLTITMVKFKNDFTGADVIPADGVYLFEKHGFAKMNPADLTYSGSNFWIYGVMEVL